MLLAYTVSNIYQRHRMRTKKAKLDDSEAGAWALPGVRLVSRILAGLN
jgi:hypothetical protein